MALNLPGIVRHINTNNLDWYVPSAAAFSGVVFSISVTNNTLAVGATNCLFCKLANHSTNDIGYWSLTHVFVTNHSGFYYELRPRLERELRSKNGGPMNAFADSRSASSTFSLSRGVSTEWPLPVVVSKSVPLGSYQLKATQGLETADDRFSWEIEGNSLEVKVIRSK